MRGRRSILLFAAFAAATFAVIAVMMRAGSRTPKPTSRVITVEAEKYGYTPSVIRVNKGDRVTLRFKAKDVTHGFYLEAYDLDAKARPQMPDFWVRRPSSGEAYRMAPEVTFIASREGKFRYRCSTTCGYMHPFMQGELIVAPNRLFPTSTALSLGTVFLMLLWFARPGEKEAAK